MGKALIAIDKSKMFRIYLGITTDVIEEARAIHQTTPVATAGLDRVLTAAGLMGIMFKGQKDKLTLIFKGDGPARQILATADGAGQVKGYIANPNVDLPATKDGKLDVGGSLGIGELRVIKDIGLKEPYIGSIALVSGEIAEDITTYFYVSEQQNTSVALGVKIADDLSVECAGGMIIQMMPNFSEEAVDALEAVLNDMPHMTTLIGETEKENKGKSQEGILEALLEKIFENISDEFKPEILEYRSLAWKCDCSRERLEEVLMTIGKKELSEIIEEDGKAELVCQFCESKYQFTKEELEEILEKI